MNRLALMWAEREIQRQEARELRRLKSEIDEKQAALAPLREKAEARRKERMRMDGPEGFVMVWK